MTVTQRPSFEEIYLNLAASLASRSTCRRLKVGTVITSTDFRKVLAVGYNGNASGLPNTCDRDEQGNCGCLHSEENAVINCDTPRDVEKYAFVTHLPCAMCAKRLINLGNVK
jgi:dCMP deaminase